ncbi:Hypothetical predicted protein [Paramuricea clavata]|uniref:Uncharacterized protein n=1 Tax=Paramuricea clavata TaxID=317549 RepID=A0A6S7FUV5_PARCT|nr:Hypothetical predicted protein [Paramuricea clavata]
MAEKRPKPCKRRKSDTLEEVVNAGLALLAKEDGPKQRRQRKPSHFRLLRVGSERMTHTPYRSRHGSTKTKGVNQQKESHLLDTINVNDNFGTDDCHTQRDIDIDEELENLISECSGFWVQKRGIPRNGLNFGSVNPRTFTKAFREWKYFYYEMEKEQSKQWMLCPSCHSDQHSCHVDGNMKLCRYKHSGSLQLTGGILRAERSKNFADDGKCGETNWRAAGNKGKRKIHLDETGLEIAGCRHAVAQWAVNMFRGEIYGYSNYIHVHKMVPNNVKYIWQDIICKYWKWALKTNLDKCCGEDDGKKELVIPPEKKLNRLIVIFQGCLYNTTKYMLPESREELITEHALAWNKRKICDMSNALCKRYAKSVKACDNTRKELDEMLSSVNLSQDNVNSVQWKSDVQFVAKELESTSFSYTSEEEECYVLTAAITGTSLLPSTMNTTSAETEEYLRALSKKVIEKYSTINDKHQRVNLLTAKLCGAVTVLCSTTR